MKIKGFISIIAALLTFTTMPAQEMLAVEPFSVGDVNGDGIVDASDASMVLCSYALASTTGNSGLSFDGERAADVDSDGVADAVDASKILAYYAYTATGGDMEFVDYMLNPPVNHSELYNEHYTTDEVIAAFNEVVLNTEYPPVCDNSSTVQKWTAPITYRIVGDVTDSDKAILGNLFYSLNDVVGFPGIVPADSMNNSNLDIYFCEEEDFYNMFGEFINYEAADGVVTYWSDDDGVIYYEQIGYMNYLSGDLRTSVLLEEVVNGLGLSDSDYRDDSIVYQYGSEATELSDMDWLIIKLLYNPLMKNGMNAEDCEKIIRQLYY